MRDASGPALHLRPSGPPELRARFFQALAHEIASVAYRAAVAFEASADRPAPDLWVRPATLVGPLLTAPAFSTVRPVRETEAAALPRPEAGRWHAIWALEPAASPAPPAHPRTLWDVPDRRALLGPHGRLDLQTFWLSGRTDGRVWVGRRARLSCPTSDDVQRRAPIVGTFAAAEWSRATGVLCRPRPLARAERDWALAASASMARNDWLAVPLPLAERTAEPRAPEGPGTNPLEEGHTIVLGASGAGKTTFLADRAARAIRDGGAVLAVDLHGDLGPAIAARLGPAERERLVAVDASRRPVVGVGALAGQDERTAAQFVAAVKRLSPDGTDVYWGFRLERIFDAFARLAQETGGNLSDLYALLTDVDRRDAARLATRTPELARFLDELGPIVRRNPEFLWPAAARLAKVVLVPELAELLAPADGGVPVEELLESGRSLLVRIPFATLGPEAASFAGSLVVARAYLGVASRREPGRPQPPLVVVLDEVQGLSPRLVSEMLAEGRKFGVRLLLASQYPERLAPELRLAAAGVSRGVVAFRVPRASAAGVGVWLGLSPAEAERWLPELPVGLGVARATGSGDLCTVVAGPAEPARDGDRWLDATERTLAEYPASRAPDAGDLDQATERLLLAVLAGEEQARPLRRERLVDASLALPGPGIDRAVLEDRRSTLERCGLVHEVGETLQLTPAGERQLGLRPSTGASRESAEHRALLLRTFRLFARHGHRLEIVRQGRFDTTLPDALFRQIPETGRAASPRELAATIASAQQGWAWRFFRGLDVHVEAEVSGALRPARVRHGLEKARSRGAFALFVVGDPDRAARVRRTLRTAGAGLDRAQVWTLRGSANAPPASSPDGKETVRCERS